MQQIKNGNGNHRRGERLKDADSAVTRLLIKNHHAERHLVNWHNILVKLMLVFVQISVGQKSDNQMSVDQTVYQKVC
jgi:hypothetical protein